jgi:hypothetical protein
MNLAALRHSVSALIMADDNITLWTMQGQGHKIDDPGAKVDLRHSHMINHSPLCLHRKYEEVRHRLGTDQVLWCFTEKPHWKKTTVDPRVLWTLQVPIDEVLDFVDEWLAERLTKGLKCPQLSEWTKWRVEAAKSHPKPQDKGKQDEFIEQRLVSYGGPHMDPDDGWQHIFVPSEQATHVSALLPVPVPPHWVI